MPDEPEMRRPSRVIVPDPPVVIIPPLAWTLIPEFSVVVLEPVAAPVPVILIFPDEDVIELRNQTP
jgi:hypothetical protein